jgi:hypothetical protein
MRYLNNLELQKFHDAFLAMCEKHAVAKDEDEWGFPSGIIDCDTYSFETKQGTTHIGHSATVVENRWWIPIGLESQAYVNELAIAFEMNIPKTRNMHLSVHYAIDDDNRIHILHKGKVTVGHSAVSMSKFFAFYRKNPGQWPIIKFSYYDYIELGKVNLVFTDDEFLGLLESLAGFANYIAGFKDNYR